MSPLELVRDTLINRMRNYSSQQFKVLKMKINDNTTKNKTISIKNNWDEITWREFEQLEQILGADIPLNYKSVHLVSLLSNTPIEEIELLPITEFQKLLPHIEFLKTEPETHSHKFEYTINGRDYEFRGEFYNLTTAQYIDYRSYMDEEMKDITKLMSVFIIPKGHDYNDGYDMEQVKNDIGDMCWLDVRACTFFFRILLGVYILTLKSSLVEGMKKNKKMPKKLKKLNIEQMEESFNNSVSSLLSSGCVNIL